MFAPHTSHASAHAYSSIHIETGVPDADSHQLVQMLFDGALAAIAAAVHALERGDVAAKCKAVTKAATIVEDGLRDALDLQGGGQVAASLQDLYACVLMRLTLANANNDAAMLRECSRLLTPLRDAWASIRPARSGR